MKKYSVIPFEFDSRMVEWNIKHNLITKEQLDKYLKGLPDDQVNSEILEIDDSDSTEQQSH